MKVLIITGGNSSERKISLLSALNVKQALIDKKYEVSLYDLKKGYQPLKKVSKNFDVLFPVLHGEEGEGGKLHKFLIKLDKPIVGTNNYKGLQNAWYKIPFKKYCDKNKILTSEWKIVHTKNDVVKFGFPCVLKTSVGGSSREVVMLKEKKDLNIYAFNKIWHIDSKKYVEKFLLGTEITVGILNDKALPVLEIIPKKGQWFSYKTKYDNSTQELPFAPSVDKKIQRSAQKIALEIHRHFELGSYSRTDFIIQNKIPYVLEVNTIPGLTKGSLMPKQAKAAGIEFNDFIEILLKSAT